MDRAQNDPLRSVGWGPFRLRGERDRADALRRRIDEAVARIEVPSNPTSSHAERSGAADPGESPRTALDPEADNLGAGDSLPTEASGTANPAVTPTPISDPDRIVTHTEIRANPPAQGDLNRSSPRTAAWTEFGDLYRGQAARLAVFAMTLGADRSRAADLAQESLATLWRRWDDVPGAPRTFAHVLVVRAARRLEAADLEAARPLHFSPAARHDAVRTGLAEMEALERQTLAATFNDLPPEDVAQVLQAETDAIESALESGRKSLERLLDGRPAQTSYDALVASVAAEMDVEAGLARIATADDVPPARASTLAGPRSTQVPDDLLAAAITGEREAVTRLLKIIRPLVVRYCRGRLGAIDRSLISADDVAQEVCLAVLAALPNYRVQGKPFLAFVYGIASHKVIDAHRAVARNRSDPVADMQEILADEVRPEERARPGELSAHLQALLNELPEKQREILVLRMVVGLSAEETAAIVGSTPGAVRVAQHRALSRAKQRSPTADNV